MTPIEAALAYFRRSTALFEQGLLDRRGYLAAAQRLIAIATEQTDLDPMPDEHPLVGSTIKAQGVVATIATVHSASNYAGSDGDCWYIEFTDTSGVSRYWKQDLDGGTLTFPETS